MTHLRDYFKSALRPTENRLLLFFAALYTLVFNGNLMQMLYEQDWAAFGTSLFLSFFVVLMIFAGLALVPMLFGVVFVVLIFISSVLLYYMLSLGIYLNENILAVLEEATPSEVFSYFSWEVLSFGIGGLLLGLAGAWWYRRRRAIGWRLRLRFLLIIILAYALACGGDYLIKPELYAVFKHCLHKTMPLSILAKPYAFYQSQRHAQETIANRTDISLQKFTAPDEDFVTVMVVGESARGDHFHLNGYPRQTSPELEQTSVISFPRVRSCGTNTRVAVPCLMTRATEKTLDVSMKETSFISVFKRAGFDTYWISNQGMYWTEFSADSLFSSSTISAIAHEAEHVFYNNTTGDTDYIRLVDGELLPAFDNALKAASPKKLIVIHTVGSHWHCDSHYPPEFARFTPLCTNHNPRRCDTNSFTNSYDNSILYTDHFLREVIKRLERRPALLFYVSDHGESLGERGNFTHSPMMDNEEVRRIPFMVWMSDAFRTRHPERYDTIKLHQSIPINQDYLFHSILGCSGFASALIDPKLDLCQ